MIKITIDSDFQEKLTRPGGPIEICDEAGQTLGIFQPLPRTANLVKASPFTDEEIRRRAMARDGRPLADILRDLDIA